MKLFTTTFVAVACIFYTTLALYNDDSFKSDDSSEYIDIRLFANETPENRNCTKPGLMCQNCNHLVNCVLGENGHFDTEDVQTCSSGQTCLRDQCTSEANPNCVTGYNFECTATGVFPDPYNCRKFHFCVAKLSSANNISIEEGAVGRTSLLCDKEHAYDPVTTYCKKVLTNGCPDSDYPVPICTKSGQSGALINKSIYYVCVVNNSKLVPKLYLCSHGKSYVNNTCV